jgi:hypothetical protein
VCNTLSLHDALPIYKQTNLLFCRIPFLVISDLKFEIPNLKGFPTTSNWSLGSSDGDGSNLGGLLFSTMCLVS